MKQALLLFLLVSNGCMRQIPAETDGQHLQRYRTALRTIQTVSYQVQRIDTFTRQDVWNHAGYGVLQRNKVDIILGANFLVARQDNSYAYFYDGRLGYEIDGKARTYVVSEAPFGPSILGSPGGQMLVEELLSVDSTYQRVSYHPSPAGPRLTFHYSDQPQVDELNRTITLVLDPVTSLPNEIITVVHRGGTRLTTHKLLTQVRVNDPADAARLNRPDFLNTYTRVAPPAPVAAPSQLGQPAPGFQLSSFAQVPVSLSHYRGRVVLLDFWTTWCSPCIASMPKLQQLQAQHQEKGLVVVGVLLDHTGDVAKPQGILQRQAVSYLNLLGTEAVRTAYNVHAYPQYVLVDKSGTIVFEGAGYSEQLEAAVKAAVAAQTP